MSIVHVTHYAIVCTCISNGFNFLLSKFWKSSDTNVSISKFCERLGSVCKQKVATENRHFVSELQFLHWFSVRVDIHHSLVNQICSVDHFCDFCQRPLSGITLNGKLYHQYFAHVAWFPRTWDIFHWRPGLTLFAEFLDQVLLPSTEEELSSLAFASSVYLSRKTAWKK